MARVGIAARVPLVLALLLHARVCRGQIDIVVIVTEKEAINRGANICSIALDPDGIVALAIFLDPSSRDRLGYTPSRVVRGASVVRSATYRI